jgi:FkbM family methyltransferase
MQKDIACRLRMSASSNALNEFIFVHNVAVSSIAGEQKSYNTNENNPGGTSLMDIVTLDARVDDTSNIVSTVTLDNLFYEKVESIPFVKVDTEGHEYEVLKSAKLLMSRNIIKHLVVEIRSHQTQMVNFLYENRFTCHLLE